MQQMMSVLQEMAEQDEPQIVKALSIRQPWAWLIINGSDGRHKDIENRTWNTNFRGRFLVHASKTLDNRGYEFVRTEMGLMLPTRDNLLKGGIIGSVKLVDVVNESDSMWFFGPYGFVLEDPRHMMFRPLKGRLNFFNVEL